MTEFAPWDAAAGGALIGLAAVWLMAANGRIAGISGIVNRLLPPYTDALLPDRVAFVVGLVVAPTIVIAFGGSVVQTISDNPVLLVVAGLLVGFGSTIGNGCTSGHGICGLSRFSKRSLAATLVFMATGALTVYVMRHVL
ncbi:MAG: YeeE/YedE thiosulfate transporter family protein [Micropepsaceae bacterium]